MKLRKHPDQTTKFEKLNMWNSFSNIEKDILKHILWKAVMPQKETPKIITNWCRKCSTFGNESNVFKHGFYFFYIKVPVLQIKYFQLAGDFELTTVGFYLVKVNNRNSRTKR